MRKCNFIYTMATAMALTGLTGCADDFEPYKGAENITVTLAIPGYENVNISRAIPDADLSASISSVKVIMKDADDNYLQTSDFTNTETDKSTFTINLSLPPAASTLEFVANAPTGLDYSGDLKVLTTTQLTPAVMWGKTAVAGLQNGESVQVPMIRNHGKISTTVATGVPFALQQIGVYDIRTSGTIAPDPSKLSDNVATSPTLPTSDTKGNVDMTNWSETSSIQIFEQEADADNVDNPTKRIIIKGEYNGTAGYYVVAFRTRNDGNTSTGTENPDGGYSYTPIPVLRNHHYKINIDYVRSAGWPTLAEAQAAKPDNRISAWLEDVTTEIDDLIANRDYALGVKNTAQAANSATSMAIDVVTSYPKNKGELYFKLKDAADASWLHLETTAGMTSTDGWYKYTGACTESTDGKSSSITWYKYNISLKIDANDEPTDRKATIIVKSGDLTREIEATQLRRDYLLDDGRQITMEMTCSDKPSQSITVSHYFRWLRGYKDPGSGSGNAGANGAIGVYGVGPECFHPISSGEEIRRDDGLIFPAVPGYTVKYTIPKLTSDGMHSLTNDQDAFKVSTSGDNLVVELNTTTEGIAQGTLTIPITINGNHYSLSLPLYRTGYLHKLGDGTADYQPQVSGVAYSGDIDYRKSGPKTGWYYYEVVPVSGFYIFDRNIGAMSNYPYSYNDGILDKHTEAVGGYFKVALSKYSTSDADHIDAAASTIVGDLGFPAGILNTSNNQNTTGFYIPTIAQMENLNIAIETVDSYIAASSPSLAKVKAVTSSKVGSVWMPHGGYYSAESLGSENRCMMWTRSVLSGAQGYGLGSPEFGYWYKYMDLYGNTTNWSNMRICDGAAGSVPDGNSVWKYMPIRLIWK